MINTNEIRSALDYVDSHDRDLWLKMGAALKDELSEEGFPIWDQWSSSAQNYNNKSTKATWKSLNAGHIRINTLFYAAIQNGYQPTKPSVSPSAEEIARRQTEKALFSHLWNKAREWGFTEKGNPCSGIKGFKETGRDVYVTDEEYQALWNASAVPLRNALDLAYLTGQRPADVLKMNAGDIVMGELHVRHNKTKTKLRISVQGKLKTLINSLPKEGRLLRNEKGEALTYSMLRNLFETARKQSEVTFQFRDLRAKAGTDKEDLEGMGAAKDQLGHSSEAMTSHYVRHRLGKKVTPTKM